LDAITDACKTGQKIEDDEVNDSYEINIFKYEILKVCVERILSEYETTDDTLGVIGGQELNISFKFAFNTLLIHNIIILNETNE